MIDLINKRFNRLVVIKRVMDDKCGNRRWLCRCDCGILKIILGCNLLTGNTKSCGCLQKELTSSRSMLHGHRINKITSGTYATWQSLIQRCIHPTHRNYKNYGGRGITVCNRWLKFENFLTDMGKKPKGYEIDRIDNNKGYYKRNCKWVTSKENNRNKRNNHLIIFNGEIQCLAAWSEQYNISQHTLTMRLRRGWPIPKALLTPVGNQGKKN